MERFTPHVAETLALRERLDLARQVGVSVVVAVAVAETYANIVNNAASNVLFMIVLLLKISRCFYATGGLCHHIARSGNTVTHLLANSMLHSSVDVWGIEVVPLFIASTILANLAEYCYVSVSLKKKGLYLSCVSPIPLS